MRWSKWVALLALTLAPSVAWAKKPLVEFDINVDGARLLIDGKVRVGSASRKERLPVTEGTHTIRVERQGYRAREQTFDVDADSTAPLIVRITLEGGKGGPPVAAAPPPKPKPPPVKKPPRPPPEEEEAQEAPRPKPKPRPPPPKRKPPPEKVAEKPPPPPKPVPAPSPPRPAPPPPRYAAPKPAPVAPPPVAFPCGEQRNGPVVVATLDYIGFETDGRIPGLMSDVIAAEIRKHDRVTAIGSKDIKKLLSKRQLYDLAGCEIDRCRAEIMTSLGVDDLLIPEMKQDKDATKIEMRLIDVRTGNDVASASREVTGGSLTEFDVVGDEVNELFGAYPLRPGAKEGVTKAFVKQKLPPPPPLPVAPFAVTVTVGGAALIAGGVFALEFASNQAQYNTYVSHTSQTPASAAQISTLAATVKTDATVSNAMLITGGALVIASVVEAALTDWRGISQQVAPPIMQDPGQEDTVTFNVQPGGLMVSWK